MSQDSSSKRFTSSGVIVFAPRTRKSDSLGIAPILPALTASKVSALRDDVIAAKVDEFKSGNDKVINWMTGQIMKSNGGKANPKVVGEILWQS